MADAGAADKPAVLIIGGLGYIGRYLALHIHKNNLASEVRLVDKVLPQLAWLSEEFAEACSSDKYLQADATREQSMDKVFTPKHAPNYTYVFNCGGETRCSQEDSVYSARSDILTQRLAKECARRRIPALIEFSTGMIYKSPSSSTIADGGCTETSPLKPWLKLAEHKVIAEDSLERIRMSAAARTDGFEPPAGNGAGATKVAEVPELRYAILRLPHVYGEHDVGFLARGLCLARVYQAKDQRMEWLYGKDLRVNTVHVKDVAQAAWLAALWVARTKHDDPEMAASRGGRVFNVADDGDTTQEDVAKIIGHMFGIETGFHSALISAFARFNLDKAVDDVNDDVLQPWADLLAEKGITRAGPISPFMERDLLRENHLSLCNKRAKRVLGWQCGEGREKLSEDRVKEVVQSYERMGWWP